MRILTRLLLVALALGVTPGVAAEAPSYTVPMGIALDAWPYPYPVHYLPLAIEGQTLRMAYMDVAPDGAANGRAVLLLHGKNFGGFYWERPIRALAQAGFRVVVPDQIGFGKSAKPDLHYGFDLLAANTIALLDALKIDRVDVIGHSMGGMLAIRFARSHAARVDHLVLEDPIGLEDYRRFVPAPSLEALFRAQLAQTPEGYRRYVKAYFAHWRPEFESLVEPYARMMLDAEYPRFAMASALTSEMIYQQPVVYDLPLVTEPTLLIIGQADHTAPGRPAAPPDLGKLMGNYPKLGRDAAAAIPGARLVEIEDVGHIPHLEVPDRFEAVLLDFLLNRQR
ncbi:MAG TPA: alpha/beta hydrolase [Stellaceae bacterium]|nr:alpha/beta hydrolase [Stellaceae bacterium]